MTLAAVTRRTKLLPLDKPATVADSGLPDVTLAAGSPSNSATPYEDEGEEALTAKASTLPRKTRVRYLVVVRRRVMRFKRPQLCLQLLRVDLTFELDPIEACAAHPAALDVGQA